ncbi:MAG: dihydrofolate reductase [Bacteroidia bacterium]|nr:dihydrofolate reductase [Bacteroidia bacterium]
MSINIIVAASSNNVIGKDNQLIWHLPDDLKFFKRTTMGCPLIMGRKTFESVGRPLPGRENIIVTRNTNFSFEGCTVVNSLTEAIETTNGNEQVFIAGGGEIYKEALSLVDIIYLTRVHHEFEGDTYFPVLNENEWVEVFREDHLKDEKHAFDFSILTFERKN